MKNYWTGKTEKAIRRLGADTTLTDRQKQEILVEAFLIRAEDDQPWPKTNDELADQIVRLTSTIYGVRL